MNTMLAARYLGPHQIVTEQVTVPLVSEGEALVQVDACGFCGSDINIIAGTHPRAQAPLTVGHELAGRIVNFANESTHEAGFHIGDRVTMFPLISCGVCYACTHGNPHVCRQLRLYGFDVDGGMAEYIKLPIASLMKLPKAMPAQIGALIEPLAVAVHGIKRADLNDVRLAVVLGAGPIGLLTALVARQHGIKEVIVSDVLPSRLALAESLGLRSVKAGTELRDLVMQLSDNNGADVCYECAGHPSSAKEMTALVRSRGVIVNLGVFKKPVEVDMQAINFKEIEVLGSRVYEREDFQTAIDMALELPLEKIVSHAFPLRSVSLAFEQFQSTDSCKVLILPSEAAA